MNPVQITILAFMAAIIFDAVSSFIRWKRSRREIR